MKKIISICLLSFLLGACSNGNRYQIDDDHAPTEIPPLGHIEDVNPRYEPYSRGGNRNYTVRGIHYKVKRNITELVEQGGASWYGNKFHGHLTSNGERYNMFAMSAAHKNLPLPSYVEVTNLANNKKIIVRVNDRGPFHEGRIIDLSYAAAKKLDMLTAGTAKVEIKLLHFNKDDDPDLLAQERNKKKNESTVEVSNQQNKVNNHEQVDRDTLNIQFLVTSSAEKAAVYSKELADKLQVPSFVAQRDELYYLRLGPLQNVSQAETLLESVKINYPQAFIVPKAH